MSKPAVSIDINQLRENADAAGQLLKALGNPDRLLLSRLSINDYVF